MQWPSGGVLLVALATLALTALALAGGAAGEEEDATESPLLVNFYGPWPLVEGARESIDLTGYFYNSGSGNLTLAVTGTVGPGFSLEPADASNFTLGPYGSNPDDSNLSSYYAAFRFYLNLTAGTTAPANATIAITVEVVAWEGNLSPAARWRNFTLEARLEAPAPALALSVSEADLTFETPGTNRRSCTTVVIENPGNLRLEVLLQLIAADGLPASYGLPYSSDSLPLTFGLWPYGGTNTEELCFTANRFAAAATHTATLRAEVIAVEGSAAPPTLVEEVELTLEIRPYSNPSIEFEDWGIELPQNRRFSIPIYLYNRGNADDLLTLNITNLASLVYNGFSFEPLPGPVWVERDAVVKLWINGTTPDVGIDTEWFEFEIEVTGLYESFSAREYRPSLSIDVESVPGIPGTPVAAAAAALALVAGRRRR